MRLFVYTFTLFLFLGMLSCGTSKKAIENAPNVELVQPPSDKAVVYLIRPSMLGQLINTKVEIDGQYVGKTKGKQYLYTILDPGAHTITSIAENTSEVPIELEAGQQYFFEQEIKMGVLKARNELVRIDEADARIKIQKCKLSKDFISEK